MLNCIYVNNNEHIEYYTSIDSKYAFQIHRGFTLIILVESIKKLCIFILFNTFSQVKKV